jgi:polar amino acid transport system substrate-binding protein
MIRSSRNEVRWRSQSDFLFQSLAALLLVVLFAGAARAQRRPPQPQSQPQPERQLNAAVFLVTPFAIEQNGSLSGFSIDLWNAIAARMGIKTTAYNVVPGEDTSAMWDVVRSDIRSGQLDVLVTPVFITSARDAEFDFSYPIMDTGLQIMVPATADAAQPPNPFMALLGLLLSTRMLLWLGIGMVLILIPAHLVWLFDRRRPDGITRGKPYFPGIFYAMLWAATALVVQSQQLPGSWLARLVAVVWMFAGVVFVAYYTAQLTTTLTVQQIRGSIEGPSDLPGKQVGALANSAAIDYLIVQNAQVQKFEQPEQMFQALLDNKVEAVVAATPILLYYAARGGKGRVRLVGSQFNTAPFAMLFPLGSQLRRKVDSALIALRENGTYQQLYEKWFGVP